MQKHEKHLREDPFLADANWDVVWRWVCCVFGRHGQLPRLLFRELGVVRCPKMEAAERIRDVLAHKKRFFMCFIWTYMRACFSGRVAKRIWGNLHY